MFDLWMDYESVGAWFIQWLSNLKRMQLKRIAWAHVGALQGPMTSLSSSSTVHPKAAAMHERRMVSKGSKVQYYCNMTYKSRWFGYILVEEDGYRQCLV